MILVHVPRITARLSYTFKLIFSTLLGCQFRFTTNDNDYVVHEDAKFSYGPLAIGAGLHFHASDLLFETGIGHPRLQVGEFEGVKTIFPVYVTNAVLPYDPFAASFFMVSRYEEYMPYIKDIYGRFPVFESLAFKQGFINRPVVNLWARQVAGILKSHFPEFNCKPGHYNFVPTFDIDQAWAYLSKGVVRNAGAMIKQAGRGQFSDIAHRLKVLTRRIPDPFDTYGYQFSLQQQFGLKPIYFILFGRYGTFDRNTPVQSVHFSKLIKSLADTAQVGLHPSYASNTDIQLLKEEKKGLEDVLNREVYCSRQHYLKLNLPETYRNLSLVDVTYDYTMGFAARPGFRAGICTPFQFYDIDFETETSITVVPFAVMDGTLRDYMDLQPKEAIKHIEALINEVKAVHGTFVSLWHNESLSETDRWLGWRRVYEELIHRAMP
ncbi:MAG: polysaccharide deacetylase family protein [Bacteroidales bacterium]|nr:polysaccharide deacetylase family protein [Bacteroidales bacterium]MDZ4203586.1 polysaccharide deacetylase family protein [Bacteroidales bacterium]